jgi:anti-anti-sigma factor
MPNTHGHWLEREDKGPVTVVRFKTDLRDTGDIRQIFDPIYAIVDHLKRNRLVLNLDKAQYLSSAALGKLVMLSRKVQAAEGRLALSPRSGLVEETLATAGLNDLFSIYPTEQEALKSLGDGPSAPAAQ